MNAMPLIRALPLLLIGSPLESAAEAAAADFDGACKDAGTSLLQTQGTLMAKAHRCNFMVDPMTPYFWDESCNNGGLGCNADGINPECRYCGDAPFTSIPCPDDAVYSDSSGCSFDTEPVADYYWDKRCRRGKVGCRADGRHTKCRFCGGTGEFRNITCPQCRFPGTPSTPYFWDNSCRNGGLGCNADGVHPECRYCAQAPFESVTCPESVRPSGSSCYFPNEPKVSYYWDVHCKMGIKGCNADGIHVHCRYCGGDVFSDISCP